MGYSRSIWRAAWLIVLVLAMTGTADIADAAIPINKMKSVIKINDEGPYLGIVVPNSFEMAPLLQSPTFVEAPHLPYLDFSGRRFRLIREVGKEKDYYCHDRTWHVKGVLHIGIAGNANPDFEIGDVTIPQYWAHTGLWNWQRHGDGPDDELAFESNGDYTRKIGYLKFSDFQSNGTKNEKAPDNLLNSVWYQPEELFPVNGVPEVRQHAFWVPVNKHYFSLAKNLEDLKLDACVNSTCLPRTPKVNRVRRGISANVLVDNGAYREFLYSKFNATPVDMESAAVALVCHQQMVPFIALRALSDLAGGGSSMSNEAAIFGPLAAQNAVVAATKFITLLST